MKTKWLATVIYESHAKRAEAARFCSQFVERFWAGAELDLAWWSFEELQEPSSAKEAVVKASVADVVVLALHPENALPLEVDFWLEQWLASRSEREGLLVGLLGSSATQAAEKHLHLRNLAHRGGLDYLTGLPEYAAHQIPDAVEPYHDRAYLMTRVMDEIMHHTPPPRLAA